MNENILTVKQLNLYVKSLLEGDQRLAFVSVTGEISNFKNHFQSGHWYFTLKDRDAAIRCVMFRGVNLKVKFKPEDGLTVVISGRVSIYEKDGQYQLYAEEMHGLGEGDIALAFRQIKEKLEAEGLFDQSSKRKLPKYPKKIAVVTSASGAAVQDILNITARRFPLCDIVVCPVSVQGGLAVKDMTDTLDRIYRLSGIDVIIIGRGGGSAEDLQQYNSESLARKIHESPVPVVSAVGHETDFTICDFVADLRAPTPSAAAELVVPDVSELLRQIYGIRSTMLSSLKGLYNRSFLKFDMLDGRLKKTFSHLCDSKSIALDRLFEKLNSITLSLITERESKLRNLISSLDALSPLKVMSRGFGAVSSAGTSITSVEDLNVGEEISVRLADGTADCTVKNIFKEKDYAAEQ